MFLLQNGLKNTYRLFDYIVDSFLPADRSGLRRDSVAYNPVKGGEVVERLKSLATDVTWIPLVNMSSDEVGATLRSSKLYVDFGAHPGKDRIPREAALSGCCVLTNRKGSASLFSDVPIANQYKLDDGDSGSAAIVEAIRDILANYTERSTDFEYWRRCIATERVEFDLQVSRIFGA
jgi:hypothetical protein